MARMKIETQTPTAVVMPFPAAAKKSQRRAEDKWSSAVIKLGYTTVPNLLLRAQARLGITPNQMNVLLHVLEHWWEADKHPWPSKGTIARRMGKSSRQVQRYLTDLEKAGHIKRIARYSGRKAQINNAYSCDGLITKLKKLEPEFAKEAALKRTRTKKLETAVAS